MIKIFILFLLNINLILADSPRYTITNVTEAFGTILETAQYSKNENALYFQDHVEQIVYRMDVETGEVTSRNIGYGPVGIVVPIQEHPGYLIVGVRTSLYTLKWGATGGDNALRLLCTVDEGKADNAIADGKVDSNGRLWFGTLGRLTGVGIEVDPSQSTLYMVDQANIARPQTKIRPVTMSGGIAWSNDNKKMFYNDCFTRNVLVYDFDLESGDISNPKIFFSYEANNITGGLVKGMTIDANDNLFVCTFDTSQILVISSSGELIETIPLPVDQAVSPVWGGKEYDILYITSGKYGIGSPKELSGSVLAVSGTGYKGKPQNNFVMPNVETY